MLKQDEMQAARKDARELEQGLTHALEEYLRFDFATHLASTGDIEQGGGKLSRLENAVADLIEKLSMQIDKMEAMGSSTSQSVTWKAQIQRLRAFLQSSQADFKKTRDMLKARQESAALLQESPYRTSFGEDDPYQRLYEKERAGINSSMRMIDENIGRALAIHGPITSQGKRIRRATSRLRNVVESIPGINQLIFAASRKEIRDNIIVATAITMCICLILWWMVSA